MRRSIFAVCDPDPSYAGFLAAYMNEKKNARYEAAPFTDAASLVSYARQAQVAVLLISPEMMIPELKECGIGQIIYLCGDGEQPEPGADCVNKYQSCDSLIAEVMNLCARERGTLYEENEQKGRTQMIGICSPVGRCGKTIFAVTLGEILGERRRCLYLNMESLSGFSSFPRMKHDPGTSGDLSDLIYLARRPGSDLMAKINQIRRTWHNLDYLPPVFSPSDAREITAEEWLMILQAIDESGEYDTLILDVGLQVGDVFKILCRCGKVIEPICKDPMSDAKVKQFSGAMQALGYGNLQDRIRQICLPDPDEEQVRDFPMQYVRGIMGNYCRRLARECSL